MGILGDDEKVICLRNDYASNTMNGTLWKVKNSRLIDYNVIMNLENEEGDKATSLTDIKFFDGTKDSPLIERQFDMDPTPWDYGYCITVHKSQGSEWGNVAVLDQSRVFRDNARRWLYTAITRAQNSLTIIK